MEIKDPLRLDVLKAAKSRGIDRHKDVAAALGISPQFVTDVLNERRRFSAELLKKAARVFEVTPERARRWQRLGATQAGWEI
jgi:transcriptional regulator with XRE-family HTH domain